MTKIEQVARAIAINHGADPDDLTPAYRTSAEDDGITRIFVSQPRPLWTLWESDARAAVEAMRGPSDLMLAQWDEVDSNIYRGDAPISGGNYWDMGIDAILKEEPK